MSETGTELGIMELYDERALYAKHNTLNHVWATSEADKGLEQ